jgi:hypothetical protein
MFRRSLIAAAVLLSMGSTAALADDIRVCINGEIVGMGAYGSMQHNGRVMVPMRGVFERLGAYVEWNPDSRMVTATRGDTNVELTIGSRFAEVNGENVAMDVPAMEIAGSTYIPLRFVSEALGSDVTWDRRTATVFIDTGERVAVRPYRRFHAYRSSIYPAGWLPTVSSVTDNLYNGCIHAGQTVKVTMNATAGGKAWFRIRGVFGESKMDEVSPGVYVGTWTEPNGREYRVNNDDILAFVLIGDRASAEFSPG